jgi:mevalonate pyrophosphate decarboxylase
VALEAVEEVSAAEEVADSAEEEVSTTDLEKCTKQFVLIVSKNVKYHSSQQKANQFIASSVFSKEKILKAQAHLEHQELSTDQKQKMILLVLNQTVNK